MLRGGGWPDRGVFEKLQIQGDVGPRRLSTCVSKETCGYNRGTIVQSSINMFVLPHLQTRLPITRDWTEALSSAVGEGHKR